MGPSPDLVPGKSDRYSLTGWTPATSLGSFFQVGFEVSTSELGGHMYTSHTQGLQPQSRAPGGTWLLPPGQHWQHQSAWWRVKKGLERTGSHLPLPVSMRKLHWIPALPETKADSVQGHTTCKWSSPGCTLWFFDSKLYAYFFHSVTRQIYTWGRWTMMRSFLPVLLVLYYACFTFNVDVGAPPTSVELESLGVGQEMWSF